MPGKITCCIIGEDSLLVKCGEILLKEGHDIHGIISSNPDIRQWSAVHRIKTFAYDDLADVLSLLSYDYLFSIANLAVLPDEVIKTPRKGAINYHDGPLPQYAGLNVTSWAILNQRNTHGITWHEMSVGVDRGDILKQVLFKIDGNETALSLNIKCFEHGFLSFKGLIKELEQGTNKPIKQDHDDRSYFGKYKRPTKAAIIDWGMSAEEISALVRAMDFGRYTNFLSMPKIQVGGDFFVVRKIIITDVPSTEIPGTIISIDGNHLRVATKSKDIELDNLFAINGAPLSITELIEQYCLGTGYTFEGLNNDIAKEITEFNSSIAKSEVYWVKQLSTLDFPDLNYFEKNMMSEGISKFQQEQINLTEEVQAFFNSLDLNPQIALASAFYLFIGRCCGKSDFSVGYTDMELIEAVKGKAKLFSECVPLKDNFDFQNNISSVLSSLAAAFERTVRHKTYARDTWGRYPELCQSTGDMGEPVFPVNIALSDDFDNLCAPKGSIVNVVIPCDIKALTILYDPSLLREGGVEELKTQFACFLDNLITKGDQKVSKLSLLTDSERERILQAWNETQVDFPDTKCVHQLFEEQVLKTPQVAAVLCDGKSLTYEMLNQRSNQLARKLQALGVGPESLVGAYIHPSFEMIVSLFGILKAGGAYVPLDPAFPKDRISYMIQDSKCQVIITEKRLKGSIGSVDAKVLTIDSEWPDIQKRKSGNLNDSVSSENLSYVIYTSGSTGNPKGVMIEHRNVVNFFTGMDACMGHDPDSDPTGTWLAVTSLSFDISVLEIFWTLARGFRIVLYTDKEDNQVHQEADAAGQCGMKDLMPHQEEGQNCLSIPEMIKYHGITHFQCTPSMASMLMYDKNAEQAFGRLEKLLIGGEAFPATLAKKLRKIVSGDVINMYGPTEATVWSTSYRLNGTSPSIPIGRPIANTQIYILDENHQPVPVGVLGELMIGGAGVGRGYFKKPELTAERFIPDPFLSDPNSRLYRTGDLARYLPDGNIEFMGRMDYQVKLRGYRIELGEIEALLNCHNTVHESVVIAREDIPGQKTLVAYVIPSKGASLNTRELRDDLLQKLPSYMVPSHILAMETFPQTPNCKIDRKALPSPGKKCPEPCDDFDRPLTQMEEALTEIWADALDVQSIGRHDNFFDMGGDNLAAQEIMAMIQRTCEVDVSPRAISQAPTVAALSAILEEAFIKQADSGYTVPAAMTANQEQSGIPDSDVAMKIARIWSEVLAIEHIGPNDNFFDLGGHSLTGVQIAFHIQAEFGVDVPLAVFFNAPTVAQLSHHIQKELGSGRTEIKESDWVVLVQEKLNLLLGNAFRQNFPAVQSVSELYDKISTLSLKERKRLESMFKEEGVDTSKFPVVARKTKEPTPLSVVQSRFWFLQKMDPDQPVYNIAVAFKISGHLDVDILLESLNTIVQRHEILRTTFPSVDGMPKQAANDFKLLDIPVMDLSTPDASSTRHDVNDLLEKEARKPFELDADAFLKFKLFKLGDNESILLLVSHHLVMDGWSSRLLMQELGELYRSRMKSEEPILPELPIQYADYALWEQVSSASKKMENHISYWKKKLQGAPIILDLPTDFQRPSIETFPGETCHIQLPKALTHQLRGFSNTEGVTIYMTLLAAFQTLLFRYSRQEDLLVGTAVANINRREIQHLVGSFSNNILLRAQFHGNPTFLKLLQEVKETLLEAYEHQDLPFEKLLEEIHADRDLSRNPLFQAAFIFHQSTLEKYLQFDELNFESIPVDLGSSRFDLTLELDDDSEGIVGFLEYKKDLFKRKTIERMAEHFITLLESIIAHPEDTVSELNVLPEKEKTYLLEDINRTVNNYPDELCVHQLFEEKASEMPERIAIEFQGKTLTYRQLNERANRVANYLVGQGVATESLVGICIERSLEMVVGLLGILKAGCAYVPMDPSFPSERLHYMLEDAKIKILLTQEHLSDRYTEFQGRIIKIDSDAEKMDLERSEEPNSIVNPENLAYVIYTSGSTGKPKGVEVPHGAVVNFLISMSREPGFEKEDVLLAVTTLSFDIAVLELFLPLIMGAKIVLVSRDVASDGMELLKSLNTSGATVMQATPSTWRLLIAAGWDGSDQLKILCGGEAFPRDLVGELLERVESVWNMYGPTETTIWSTCCRLLDKDSTVLIGKPIDNTQTYVLNGRMQLMPVGVPGELYIGGAGVTRGYLNRPDLTSNQFVPDPFNRDPKARLYKTGDLVRCTSNGNFQYLKRLDTQVKVRGFRIELGEIETVLAEHSGLSQAVVNVWEDRPGDGRLVAYIIFESGQGLTQTELRKHLRIKLPEYMIPQHYIEMDVMPLTPSGKIDRKNLPAPSSVGVAKGDDHVEPRNKSEKEMAEIWIDVLNIEQVSVHDNFFDIGGHSLLAMTLIERIRKQTGILLSPRVILLNTLGQIANEYLLAKNVEDKNSENDDVGTLQATPARLIFHKFKEKFSRLFR